MSFHKYKMPSVLADGKEKSLWVCDTCGVIITTDGSKPQKCPVCGDKEEDE